MNEFGRIKRLMEIIDSPAHTMQDCDRKRVAMLELGNMGNVTAVPVLLDYIDHPLFSITAIDALGKLDFEKTDGKLDEVTAAIKGKMENGSIYERISAKNVLEKLENNKKSRHSENPKREVALKKKIRT